MAQRPCRSIGRLTLAFCLTLSLFLAQAKNKGKGKDPDAIGCRDVGKGLNFYSLEKETALGKQMTQEVERDAKIVYDPVIAEYVSRLGQNLARSSDAKVPFTIKILDTSEVNAFALPGGFLFVNSGLIAIAGNEAELAGVMAHEKRRVTVRARLPGATLPTLRRFPSSSLEVGLDLPSIRRLAPPFRSLSSSFPVGSRRKPTCWVSSTCIRQGTILPRLSTSSRRSRHWRKRRRGRSPRCSQRIP